MDDDERARLLQRFADGSVRVLVCTDILARGIDTLEAAHVIQAEFATDATSHLHRVGRTGRAGEAAWCAGGATRELAPLSVVSPCSLARPLRPRHEPCDPRQPGPRAASCRIRR